MELFGQLIFTILCLVLIVQSTIKEPQSESAKHLEDEDFEHILSDAVSLDNFETSSSIGDGPVKLNIVGDTSHLFADEDFQKREVILLHNGTSASTDEPITSPEPSLVDSKKPQQSPPSTTTTNCANSNLTTDRPDNAVKLVNGSYLTRLLSDSAPLECFLVLFYVPWCPFSARLAPIYNALPKAFANLDILAFDVSKSIGYNTKFGTSAVPIVLLFQHKNVLAKFNYTEKNLTEFIEFVSLKSGFKGNKSIEIEEEDFLGPVPTVAQKRFDFYLLISWIFLVFVSVDLAIRKTKLRIYLIRWLRRLAYLIRRVNYGENNLMELDEPVRLQAIENNNQNHPHNE